jgi:hypothetical protein
VLAYNIHIEGDCDMFIKKLKEIILKDLSDKRKIDLENEIYTVTQNAILTYLEHSYKTCPECYTIFHKDDLHYVGEFDTGVCDNCYNELMKKL